MTAENIDILFLKIDRIQFDVFDKIDEILTLHTSPGQTQSIDELRSTLSKSANALINKVPGLLDVISVQIQQESSSSVETEYLNEKLQLYKEKVNYLKLKLRESQLVASSMENELTHKQRLQEYVKEESAEPADLKSELFAGRSQSQTDDNEKPIDEQVLTQNQNITSSLKATKQLMTMSVMQTELNIDSLDQQSRDLSKLNDKLIDLESVLLKSRQIVKFIEKQDKHDKRRIYLSIGFLLLCSAWVLWRRVLKLPVKILLWSLLKFFGVFNWVVSKYPSSSMGKQITHPFSEDIQATSLSIFPTSAPIDEVRSGEKEQEFSILPIETELPSHEIETETALSEQDKATEPEAYQGEAEPVENLEVTEAEAIDDEPNEHKKVEVEDASQKEELPTVADSFDTAVHEELNKNVVEEVVEETYDDNATNVPEAQEVQETEAREEENIHIEENAPAEASDWGEEDTSIDEEPQFEETLSAEEPGKENEHIERDSESIQGSDAGNEQEINHAELEVDTSEFPDSSVGSEVVIDIAASDILPEIESLDSLLADESADVATSQAEVEHSADTVLDASLELTQGHHPTPEAQPENQDNSIPQQDVSGETLAEDTKEFIQDVDTDQQAQIWEDLSEDGRIIDEL